MIAYQTVLLYFFMVLVSCVDSQDDPCTKTSSSAAGRLRNRLYCSFKHKGPPVVGRNIPDLYDTKVTVQVTLHLAFIKFDIQKSRLLVNNWLELGFSTARAQWDPKDFDSLTKIDIEGDKIWLPDLSIYNKHDLSKTTDAIGSARCIASSDGHIQCVAPSQHDGLCVPDLTRFPFDTHMCNMKYGSWIHNGEEMNITVTDTPIQFDTFTKNPQWELLDAKGTRDPGMFNGDSYPYLKYVFVLKRYGALYRATIVAPAIVLMFVTLTTLLIDFDSSDRVNIGAFNLVCHFLFVQNVYWLVPIAGNKPLIVIFFRDSTLLCGILIVLTIIFKNIAQKKTNTPKFINWIVSSYVGQTIGTFKYSVQIAVSSDKDDEEGKTIVDLKEQEKNENWVVFAILLNRITIVVYCVIYLTMSVKFLAFE